MSNKITTIEDGIYIKKDLSEKTYEYEVIKDGQSILFGDGNESINEIIDWFNDIVKASNNIRVIEEE